MKKLLLALLAVLVLAAPAAAATSTVTLAWDASPGAAGNESGYSNECSTTTDANAPPAPGNLRVVVTVAVQP